jgi:hypothetical protein
MEQYHPSTLAELLNSLETIFSQEALEDIKEYRALDELQLTLGPFILKHLVLKNDNWRALYNDCGKEMPREVSQLAVLRLQERLRGAT